MKEGGERGGDRGRRGKLELFREEKGESLMKGLRDRVMQGVKQR